MSIISVFPIGNGTGGSGGTTPSAPLYSVGPVKNVVATPDNGAIKLTWDDPEDLTQANATVAEWEGTKVVYKEGNSIPTTPEDGTTAIYSTTRNAYSSEPLVVSGLAQETAYGINLFPCTKAGVVSHAVPTGKQLTTYGDMTLNNCSWAQIREISDAGTAANYWKVGDTKTIVIDGKVGNTTFSNLSIDVFIIGFNHNASREGNNRIHFQIGKIDNKFVGLVDIQYNTEVTARGYFYMNISRTNTGGWSNSDMRKTLLGNTSSPTSPLAGSLMSALPSELISVIKSCTKYTDNTGGGKDTASYVTSTTDYLFLLSEFEVCGKRYIANSAEQNHQMQYDYYKSGNNRIAYKYNDLSNAMWWWLRSPRHDSTTFCVIHTTGGITNCSTTKSGGLCPAFCV